MIRKEIVKFNECYSKEIDINLGTFQGSILSPLLSALYSSGISQDIRLNSK